MHVISSVTLNFPYLISVISHYAFGNTELYILIIIMIMCGSKNYPYLPHGRDFSLDPPPLWKFQPSFIHLLKLLLGVWELPTPQEFPIPSVGRVWIFSGTTPWKYIPPLPWVHHEHCQKHTGCHLWDQE